MRKLVLAIAVVACTLHPQAFSQTFDVNGPNANLTIQGQVPSAANAMTHDVAVPVSGTLDLKITTGNNGGVGLIFLGSAIDPTGAIVPGVPWGGSIDIGSPSGGGVANVVPIGDGIGLSVNPVSDLFFASNNGNPNLNSPPQFVLSFAVGSVLAGSAIAFQSIVFDPSNPPFNLDNTEVGDANFVDGQVLNLSMGVDGSATVQFLAPNVFNFHGQTYTNINVAANGYVTFGAPTTLNPHSFGIFHNDSLGWVNAEPSISTQLSHWNPRSNSIFDGVLYEELGNQVRVSWGDPLTQSAGGMRHQGEADSNLFELYLVLDDGVDPLEGEFEISSLNLDPTAITEFGNGIMGHTPGGVAVTGGIYDVHLRSFAQVAGPNEAQIEEHDFDGQFISRAGYDGLGTKRNYNNVTTNWNSAAVRFIPQTSVIAGDGGYSSVPLGGAEPADVTGLDVTGMQSQGGEAIIIAGSFHTFSPTGLGTVQVEDVLNPGVALPGTVVSGVLDDAGVSGVAAIANASPMDPTTLQKEVRDAQGVVFTTPPMFGIANVQVIVNFESGETFNVGPIPVTSTGITFTSYTLSDCGDVNHPLTVPVSWYGVNRTSLFINANGYITFDIGSDNFTADGPTFFGGIGQPNNPAVAVMWCDLNFGGATSGATYEVTEDSINNTVEVKFANQNHWNSGEFAGTVTATFNPSLGVGSVTLDYTNYVPATTETQNLGTGITDGDILTGTDTDHSNGLGTGLSSQLSLLVDGVGTGPNSHLELIPPNAALSAVFNWADQTGNGEWFLF